MIVSVLAVLVLGYLLGNINGAVLISRSLAHDDVRTHGSGNAGFTNYFRNYGGLNSLLVLAIDFLKAFLACWLGRLLLGSAGYPTEGAALGAVAVALGHDFPALLNFKGGKGIICGFASAFVIDWRIAIVLLVVFGAFYLTTFYVSLGSVMAAISFCVSVLVLHSDKPMVLIGGLFVGGLAIFMHRENIVRLLKHQERKTNFFKREKK